MAIRRYKLCVLGVLALVCAIVLTCPTAQAHAPEQTVRVGFFTFAGFHDLDSSGQRSGYGYEYLQELAKYTGWEYEYVEGTWDECLDMLAQGEIDLLGSAQRTPARDEIFEFPSLESGVSYAVLCANADNTALAYEDFASFDGITVGLLEGSSRNRQMADYSAAHNFGIQTRIYSEQEALTAALKSGQVDAVLTSNLRLTSGERIIARLSSSPFYFMTTKGNQAILDGLNAAQEQIKAADPYYDLRLYEKYYGAAESNALVLTRAELEYASRSTPLRVAYNESWVPLEYTDPKTGAFCGVAADLFAILTEQTGLTFTFLPTAGLEEAARLIRIGEADLISGFSADYGWAERYDVRLTAPYLSVYNVMVTRRGSELSGVPSTVALTPNNLPALQRSLGAADSPTQAQFYADTVGCLEAVLRGEVAASYVSTYSMSYLRSQTRYAGLEATAITGLKDELCIAMPRRVDPQLASILDKAITHLPSEVVDRLVISNTTAPGSATLVDVLNQNPAQAMAVLAIVFLVIIGALVFILRQRSWSNRKIYELLYLDALTGIWNYNKFRAEVPKLLAGRGDRKYAFLSSDISRFRVFNDTYGYAQGDELLRQLARIIGAHVGPGERFARMGEDNFIILLEYTDQETFEARLKAFLSALASVRVGDWDLYRIVLISGIYLIEPHDQTELTAMLDRANAARKQASSARSSALAYYSDELHQAAELRQEIESAMDEALASGQFVPFLQPQFDLQTGRITGMEALVRWFHPRRGLIGPDVFIPLFEENGFVIELDLFIFEQCCRIQRERLDLGKVCTTLSCNFSRLHVRKADFTRRLIAIADLYQVPRTLLQIEITESAAEENPERLVSLLKELRAMGFSIAMDDFGSGYSSLNLLNSLPVDVLKLDKDFLHRSFVGWRERVIIEGFVTIARKLDLTVVCEGVETQEQADFLSRIGCHTAQGFLYARPLPLGEAEVLFDANLSRLGAEVGVHGQL